jgi:hypothetical protein
LNELAATFDNLNQVIKERTGLANLDELDAQEAALEDRVNGKIQQVAKALAKKAKSKQEVG